MRKLGLIVAWVAATVLATAVAVAAVGGVAGSVVDTPSPAPPAHVASGPTSTTVGDAVPTSAVTTTDVSSPSGATSTSVTSPDTVVTSTSQAPSPTTVASSTATYWLEGGWVRVDYGPGVVTLSATGPSAGFTVEVKKTGPDDVDVEFESEDAKSRFHARATAGDPTIEIEED